MPMSCLTIYQDEQNPRADLRTELPLEIAELLQDYHIVYRRAAQTADVADIIADRDLQLDIKRNIVPLDRQHQFPFASVMAVDHAYPNLERLRMRYLSEYRLDKDEMLLVLQGQLLLAFHSGRQVLQLLCEPGDFVLIPGGLLRWLDIGAAPASLVFMKFMQQAQDQVQHYTGSHIADFFPRLEP